MQNPYKILLRFIMWEQMDLEAIIDTIQQKAIVDKKISSL